jgi:NADH-quinone oxidoreductase subunit D
LGARRCGFEQALATRTSLQAPLIAARLDGFSSMNLDLAYALAVEQMLNLEPPLRAQRVRVILAELQRVNSHLFWLARATQRLFAPTFAASSYAWRARQRILEVFQWLGGNPVTPDLIAVGGLACTLPTDFEPRLQALAADLATWIHDLNVLIGESEAAQEVLSDCGVIDPGTALGLGVTGPTLRACGVGYDVRAAFPYAGYAALQIDVPVQRGGDAWSRLQVRLSEAAYSLKLIQTVSADLPAGPVNALAEPGNVSELPPLRLPKGVTYAAVESPRGELGLLLVGDGTSQPAQIYVRGPSLANLSALSLMARGLEPHQLELLVDSLDISLAEAER